MLGVGTSQPGADQSQISFGTLRGSMDHVSAPWPVMQALQKLPMQSADPSLRACSILKSTPGNSSSNTLLRHGSLRFS